MPGKHTNVSQLDILIADHDATVRESLAEQCTGQSWTVRTVGDGEEVLLLCQERRPDIVVLDLQLPRRSGIEVCAALRVSYRDSVGVVFVSKRNEELDVVMGLEVGADDYVAKPFRPGELVARIKAVARRTRRTREVAQPAQSEDEVLVRGDVRIELTTRRVSVGDRTLSKLTGTEFALLVLLARSPERIYTRQQLLDRVWDSANEGYERNVDCHVTRLRKKLVAVGLDPASIESVYGVGYRFMVVRAKRLRDAS